MNETVKWALTVIIGGGVIYALLAFGQVWGWFESWRDR